MNLTRVENKNKMDFVVIQVAGISNRNRDKEENQNKDEWKKRADSVNVSTMCESYQHNFLFQYKSFSNFLYDK